MNHSKYLWDIWTGNIKKNQNQEVNKEITVNDNKLKPNKIMKKKVHSVYRNNYMNESEFDRKRKRSSLDITNNENGNEYQE